MQRNATVMLTVTLISVIVATGCGVKPTSKRSEPNSVLAQQQELLRDKDWHVREVAAKRLQQMGPEAKSAIPALTELLQDEHVEVWMAAAGALKTIGPEAVSALTNLLQDRKRRLGAAHALGMIGSEAKGAVPALTNMLVDNDFEARLAAAEALGGIGADASAAIPPLAALIRGKARPRREPQESRELGRTAQQARFLRDAGERALGKIGPAAIPALTELLQAKNPGEVVRACHREDTASTRTD